VRKAARMNKKTVSAKLDSISKRRGALGAGAARHTARYSGKLASRYQPSAKRDFQPRLLLKIFWAVDFQGLRQSVMVVFSDR
jgi:hypothetical protein